MFALPWGLLLRLGGAILLAITLAVAWHEFTEHYREQGRAELRPQIAALEQSIKQAQDRATAIAMLWSAQVDKTEQASRQQETERAHTFATLQDDARRAANAAPARFSPDAVSVLQRARDASEPAPTGPAAKPAETPTAAPSASWEEWGVAMYEWAAVCRARVDAWATFYRSIQEASK